jgi:ubiquinone/menaquinone biosynthesis C-methylase UbiE
MPVSNVTTTDAMLTIRDRYLAPSLLVPFADDLARRLGRMTVGPLLEIIADTGILTQAIASAISAGLTIIATDPTEEVVAHASKKPGLARIAWQIADPRALPFPNETFGVVTCHFGVAAMPDRIQAFQDTRRVMKKGGRFVFSVPGHIRHNPVADCLQDTMDGLFPTDPPRFLEHILHGYNDSETIDDDLTAAGFTDAVYTTVDLPYAAASAQDVAMGYCLGTPLYSEIEKRAPGEADRVTGAVITAIKERFGSGPIATRMRAHIVSASG